MQMHSFLIMATVPPKLTRASCSNHRRQVNADFWFSDASKIPVESDTDDDGAPQISLAEMLEELSLMDATGGEGADMMMD